MALAGLALGDLLRLRLGAVTTISVFRGEGERTGDVAGLSDPVASTKQYLIYVRLAQLTRGQTNQNTKTVI